MPSVACTILVMLLMPCIKLKYSFYTTGPSNQVIELKEIIAVRADHRSPIKDRKVTSPNKPSLLQEEKSSGTNTFSIFIIKVCSVSFLKYVFYKLGVGLKSKAKVVSACLLQLK